MGTQSGRRLRALPSAGAAPPVPRCSPDLPNRSGSHGQKGHQQWDPPFSAAFAANAARGVSNTAATKILRFQAFIFALLGAQVSAAPMVIGTSRPKRDRLQDGGSSPVALFSRRCEGRRLGGGRSCPALANSWSAGLDSLGVRRRR